MVAPNRAPQQTVVAISRNGGKSFEAPVSANRQKSTRRAVRNLP